MQLCSKNTLEDWIWSNERTQNKIIDIDKIYNFCEQILDALNHIHEKGFIHRDIKPSNSILKYKNSFFNQRKHY
jgi:serine/threonine protein kinase